MSMVTLSMGFDEALEDGIISFEERGFLQAVALDMDMSHDEQEMVVLLFALASARLNASPDQVHPAIREAVGRDTLEDGIAALPDVFAADVPLLHAMWRHLPLLDEQESREAIIEVCRLAAALEGVQLGPVPTCAFFLPGMPS